MKLRSIIISAFIGCFFILPTSHLFAQRPSSSNSIYPIPQKTTLLYDSIPYSGIKLKGKAPASSKKVLQPYYANQGVTVRFKLDKHLQHQEGYTLHITKRGILISYCDQRGAFYGAETLTQILDHTNSSSFLPLLSIEDYPDIARRGVVEGFYGTPWSYKDRVAQLKFYGRWKMNTYIYGPKDDLYHSSPNWRKPYPTRQANRLKALVKVAKNNAVDFYWAIHPGKDIKWNKQDSLAVLRKFESMYKLGVRHFAVFFDDIQGAGTDAKKQAVC